MKLGQRIVQELGFADRVDTLGRWMAHRVAELMERAEQAKEGSEREAARRECVDLIMRLWAHRANHQHGRPLAEIARFLETFADPVPARHQVPPGLEKGSWIYVLHRIVQLGEREEEVCRAAAIAEIPLEREREWLAEHRDDLSEDERTIIERLMQLQDRGRSGYFTLDDTNVPDFGSLPPEERTRHALERLIEINTERQRLVEEMRGGNTSLGQVSSEGSGSEE